MLQGWPIFHPRWAALLEKADNSLLQSLAGNAFSCTVMEALVCAVMFAVDGKDRPDPEQDDEVGEEYLSGKTDALAALDLFASASSIQR